MLLVVVLELIVDEVEEWRLFQGQMECMGEVQHLP
jgi:hypothetical protein